MNDPRITKQRAQELDMFNIKKKKPKTIPLSKIFKGLKKKKKKS